MDNLQDLYTPDQCSLIEQAFLYTDTFLGVDNAITSNISVEKPEDVDPIFDKSSAGFRIDTNQNVSGSIEFNPFMFALIPDPEFKRKKIREALIEERVHAIHILGNSALREMFSQLTLDARKFNQSYPGYNVQRATTADLVDIDKTLITRISEVANFFGIDLDRDFDKEGLEYESYFSVITSSELGVPALRKLAVLFCDKFQIDIQQIPKEVTQGMDPQRSTSIALASFIRSIIKDGKSFPNKSDLISFAKKIGIRPLTSNGYKTIVIERLSQVDKQVFLSNFKEFISNCNDIQVLRQLLQLHSPVPMSQEKILIMKKLNIAEKDSNIIQLRDSLVELFSLIDIGMFDPLALEFLIDRAISQIINGISRAAYDQGLAETLSILEYADLPLDPDNRRIFLANQDYLKEMVTLMRQHPEGIGENGYSPLKSNPTSGLSSDTRASLDLSLRDSAINSLVEKGWGSVYDAIIAQNIAIILKVDQTSEEIMSASIQLAKRKQYLDFLVEPLAKVIAMWLSNGDIRVETIISQLSSYVNIDIVSESLLQKMVETLSSWVSNNNLSKLKLFMSQSTVKGQLRVLGIES